MPRPSFDPTGPFNLTTMPQTPDEWAQVSDDDLIQITQEYGYMHTVTHLESNRRLTAALRDFKASADRASFRLILFTVAIAVLTLVLVADAILRHFE